MYVYRRIQDGPYNTLYTVGFYCGDTGQWEPESDWGTKDEAARRVAWLNGNQDLTELQKTVQTICNVLMINAEKSAD